MATLEDLLVARAVFRWAVDAHLINRREYIYLLNCLRSREARVVMCTGKQGFTTYGLADRVARRWRAPGEKMHPFKCKYCGLFHVGHTTPGHRRAVQRRRIRLLEKADA